MNNQSPYPLGAVKLASVAKIFVVLGAGHILAKIIGLASNAVMGRSLGPSETGILGSALTIVGYVLVVSNWGSDAIGIRALAVAPELAARLRIRIIRLRLVFGILAAGIAVAVCIAWRVDPGMTIPLGLSVLVFAFRGDWLLLAIGKASSVAIASTGREVAFLVALIATIRTGGTAAAAAWCILLADVVWAGLTQALIGFRQVSKGQGSATLRPSLVGEGWPLLIMALMSLTYNKIDTPLLALMRSTSEAGTYWAAYTVIFALGGLGGVLAKSALPEMSRVHHAGSSSHGDLGVLCGVAAVGGVAAALVVVGSAEAILGGLYGPSFFGGANALALLAWAIPMSVTSGVLLSHAVATGRQRSIALGTVLAASLNVASNLLLIRPYGMNGAAFGTLLSEGTLVATGAIAVMDARVRGQILLMLGWIVAPAVACAIILPKLVGVTGPALSAILLGSFLIVVSPQLLVIWKRVVRMGGITE